MPPEREGQKQGSSYPGAPRWVTAVWVILGAILILLAAAFLLPGEHGPGRHMHAAEETKAPVQDESGTPKP